MKAFNRGVALLLALFVRSALAVIGLCIAVMVIMSVIIAPALATDNVEDRKAVLEAQIEIVRKQGELNEALWRAAGSSALRLPTVVSVSRVGDRRIAKLQMPNGVAEYFREGEMVRQGMMVSVISPKQVVVTVEQGKRRVPVALEYAGASNLNPNGLPAGAPGGPQSIPPELLPLPPDVKVPAIEVIPNAPAPAKTQAAQQAKATDMPVLTPTPQKGK